MLLLYVRYERSYDEWLPNAENVYQLQGTLTDPGTQEVTEIQVSPFIAGETLRKDFPQIEAKAYLQRANPIVTRNGQSLRSRTARSSTAICSIFFSCPSPSATPERRCAKSGQQCCPGPRRSGCLEALIQLARSCR
jgi:hypothetical protein